MEICFCEDSKDLKIICKLAQKIYFEHYKQFLSKEFITYWVDLYQSYENITQSINDGEKYFFIKDNDNILGYFSYKLEAGNRLFISKLYLKAKYRKKGYGKKCLNYLFDIAKTKQVKDIFLKTMRINPTVKFYIKQGFKITDAVETNLGNGYILEDYILVKDITE